jgi:formate hydrogenlyase subunit 3/multisubunit Na+/H+ antiporter MnhD subunit
VPLTWFIGVLTFSPAIAALLIALAGFIRFIRPRAPLVLAIAALGALIPAICLLLLVPDLASGQPIFTSLAGGVGLNDWFAAAYRLDDLGLYAAFGLAFVVSPLLLWMAWQRGASSATDLPTEVVDAPDAPPPAPTPFLRRDLALPVWAGLALALTVESAALTLIFADNVLWLALAWIVLALAAWALGEIGSDLATLDRYGLALMLAGPVLYPLILFAPANLTHGPRVFFPRFTDMIGRGGITPVHAAILALVLALATGAYPFSVWLRRRAALISPAGLGALCLAVVPAALLVAARTYAVAQDATNSWQRIGAARPPITAGIAFILLGCLTVAASGLLALERRDGRALLAFLAAAQAGWGLLALGIGASASVLGLITLLATQTLGLAAMLAALYAGGALTGDVEPDAAGPRVLGAPMRPIPLAAWTLGAASLIGTPLFAGFVPRQLISAGALQARGLAIPLAGLAWAGDALLALALLRATAPAFVRTYQLLAASKPQVIARANEVDEVDGDFASPAPIHPLVARLTGSLALADVAPALLALLTLALAVAPQALIAVGARPALDDLLQPTALRAAGSASPLGYTAGPGQWLPTLAWLALLVLAVLLAILLPAGSRQSRPAFLSGLAARMDVDRADQLSAERGIAPEADIPPVELAHLAPPAQAWHDLHGAFTSAWTLPGGEQLLRGIDDDVDEAASPEDATAAEADASDAADQADQVDQATPAEPAPAIADETPADPGAEAETTLISRANGTPGFTVTPRDSTNRKRQPRSGGGAGKGA